MSQQEQLEAIWSLVHSLRRTGTQKEAFMTAITALIQEAEERGYKKHAQEVVDTIEASWVSGGSNND